MTTSFYELTDEEKATLSPAEQKELAAQLQSDLERDTEARGGLSQEEWEIQHAAYLKRTVCVNAWLLHELLIDCLGDPAHLMTPRPAARMFWGEVTDEGATITDDDGKVYGFVSWEDLRPLFADIRNIRLHAVMVAAQRRPIVRKPSEAKGMGA